MFRAVGYRPVYKLNSVQSCPRADIVLLFVLIRDIRLASVTPFEG